jgi:cytochrome c553
MKKLLLGSAVAVALLTGCGEEKKESTQTTETKQEIKKDETTTQAVAEKTSEQVKENSQKIEEPKETTTTVVQTKEKVIIAPDKVEGEVKEVVKEAAIDATALFVTCGSCHGQKAEKAALGKSQVIAGWDKQRIVDALKGYKNGTYGGVMKNIMTGQVNNKTDAEIDALADLISKM